MSVNEFDTIDLLSGDTFMVTWDTGRRCNYDCSYCPAHRHDNFSPHATLDELKNGADFLFEYAKTIMPIKKWKWCNVSFTGGEPTVNPNFLPFVKYLKNLYEEKYSEDFNLNLTLTSNGAMSIKTADGIMELMSHATISYHVEASKKIKDNVVKVIEHMSANPDFKCKVNVMFHAQEDYFQECIELCEYFDSVGIKYVPRVIGEEEDSKPTLAHKYTDEQLQWFRDYWNKDTKKLNKEPKKSQCDAEYCASAAPKEVPVVGNKKEEKQHGSSIGRPCCGGRQMNLYDSTGDSIKSKFVGFRQFKGWYCSVNWFFLHIEQQTDSIYHHQTCQAKLDGTKGPIGKLSEGHKVIEELKHSIQTNTMPVIVCPNKNCGCGLCIPKSKEYSKLMKVLPNTLETTEIFTNE